MRKHIALLGVFLLLACSGSGDGLSANEVAFHSDQDLLPGFHLDTGPQPSSGPVQLQLVVSSSGKATIDAVGVGTDAGGTPSLVGKAASGKIAIDGGFTFSGHLKVDVSGVASYDGDVPGLANASITFGGSSAFDPFLLATTSDVSAPVVGTLPSIPLPGGLPGTLDLTIDPGTTFDFSLHGTCAALDGDQATYHASLTRTGTLKITPVVTLKVPVVGSKKFSLPAVTVELPSAPSDVDLGTHTVTFGADDVAGERATQTSCDAPAAASDGGTDAGTAGDSSTKADAKADANPTYSPASASCSSSGFVGTLTLTPSADGKTWNGALLSVSGTAGTHNNAVIYREQDGWQGSTLTSSTTTQILATTDDFVANDPPRAIADWTAQPRTPIVTGGTTTTYRYEAKVIFDKSGTDPSCTTTQIGVAP